MSGKENGVLGSLMNGLGTNALAGNDPVKGLAINAALLAGSGGLSGLGSAGASASTAANTGLGMAGNAAQTMPGAVGAYGQTVPAMSNVVTEAAASSVDDLIGQGLSADLALSAGTPAAYTGMGMAGNTAPSFLDKLGAGVNEIGQYAQQNPVLTAMAAQTAQGLLTNQQQAPASAGLMRGNQIQAQAPQYQLGSPKVSLI